MEVLRPAGNDPAVAIPSPAQGSAPTTAEEAETVASPRTRRMVTHLLQRVFSLSRKNSSQQQQDLLAECNNSSSSIISSITVTKKCPYSAVEKNPSCPYVFQMPLHYPRYTKAEYEAMPEWQLDRLLEEYGVPVTGSLSDKREYAIGAFLWRN